METNFNPLENLAKDLGIDIFDNPPSPEPQPEPSAASSEPNAGDSSLTSDPEPQPQPQPEPLEDGSTCFTRRVDTKAETTMMSPTRRRLISSTRISRRISELGLKP